MTINGDITKVDKGIIVHQVNCKKVMGAGLAKALREKYPKHYEEYRLTKPKLGDIIITEIKNDLYIIGMYAQNGYGRNSCYTEYQSFGECLDKVHEFGEQKHLQIYIPYGIGCGLANGDWNIIKDLINDKCAEAILIKRV